MMAPMPGSSASDADSPHNPLPSSQWPVMWLAQTPFLMSLALGAYAAGRQDERCSGRGRKKRSRSVGRAPLSPLAWGDEEGPPPEKRLTPRGHERNRFDFPSGGNVDEATGDASNLACPSPRLWSSLQPGGNSPLRHCKGGALANMLSVALESHHEASKVRPVRFVTDVVSHLGASEETVQDSAPPIAFWMAGADARGLVEEGSAFGWLDFAVGSLEEMYNYDWEQRVHRKDRDVVRAVVKASQRSGKPFQVEYRIKTSSRAGTPGADSASPPPTSSFYHDTFKQFSGEDPMMYRWVQEYGRPRIGLDGQLRGYVGWQCDIHERKRQEEDHEIYWKLPHLALYRADTSGTFFKKVSPALLLMLGMSMDEFLSTPWMDLVHPDDQQPSIDQYRKLGEGTNVVDFTNRYMCKKDSDVPGPVYIDPITADHYKYLGWTACVYTGAVRDITAEVKAQEELARSKRELQRITDAVPGGVFRYCQTGSGGFMFPFVSKGIQDVLGMDAAELMADPALLHTMMHPEDTAALHTALEASVDTMQPLDIECRIQKNPLEEFRWVHIHALPQKMETGAVEWCGVMTDRTNRHQQEDLLREAKVLAEKANTAKGAFLSNMSHEIRTPMNAVLGMAALLLDSTLSPDQREFASTIRSSGEALLNIINDILDYSKIEAGKLELEEVPLDIRDCIEDSLDLVTTQAVAKGLELTYTIEETVPDVLLGDVSRLRQVLVNLLTNAVKFTAHGSISVSVSARLISAAEDDDIARARALSGIRTPPPTRTPKPSPRQSIVSDGETWVPLPSVSASEQSSGVALLDRRPSEESVNGGRVSDSEEVIVVDTSRLGGAQGGLEDGSLGGLYEIHIACQDTGIGIPSNRSHALFQSFSQVDPSTTRKYGGTGLGLAICAKLCQLMGGKIWVESELDHGSAFHFTCQARALPASQRRVLPDNVQEALEKKRVLLIAGIANAGSTKMLEQLLRGWKMRPLPVESGEEAIDLMGRSEGQGFSLVIVDHRQVERKDPALVRCLQLCRTERHIPLLLLNLHGRRNADTLKAEGIEFAAQLNKPIKSSQLLNSLVALFAASSSQFFTKMRSESIASYPSDMGVQYPLRILVAEDNPINQRVLLRLLSRLGYSADVVGNGAEALEALQRQRYDACLMDCFMPEMDGLEATRQIRKVVFPSPIVIAVTAAVLEEERKACTDAGMDMYIAKPLQMAELIRVLRKAWEAVH